MIKLMLFPYFLTSVAFLPSVDEVANLSLNGHTKNDVKVASSAKVGQYGNGSKKIHKHFQLSFPCLQKLICHLLYLVHSSE